MEIKKFTGYTKVWTSSKWADYGYVQGLAADGNNDEAASRLSFTNNDMSDATDWTEVGIATITVEFYPREQIIAKQIDGLREQLRRHRINAHLSEQAILEQISKLQALTFEPA